MSEAVQFRLRERLEPELAELMWQVFFVERSRGQRLDLHFPLLASPQARHHFASLHQSDRLLAGLCVRHLPGPGRQAMLGLVCVRPEDRGQGWGARLLSDALTALDDLGIDAVTLWTRKPGVYRGHGFLPEDPGCFGKVEWWPEQARHALAQQAPRVLPWAGAATGLPAFAFHGQRLGSADGRAEIFVTYDDQGSALAQWSGSDAAVLELIAACLPPRWRLNALATDTLADALRGAGARVELAPSQLQMWRDRPGSTPQPRPPLRLLDRL